MASRLLTRVSFGYLNRTTCRTYLSSSYLCNDEWSKLLQNDPLISKAQQDKLFTELIQRYNGKLAVGAIDVDVFSHKITDASQIEELTHILSLFRKTRRAVDVLDSTHHAVCRTFISLNLHDQLLSILEKRTEYGIFPDDYIYNALLDHYLEKKEVSKAFRVACLYMLQENYSNVITRTLSLHSAFKWLTRDSTDDAVEGASKNNGEEESAAAENEEAADDDDDEDDEPQYIRVPFLRNEYNDEHFDLTDNSVLCGKIFHYIGMRTKDPLGINMQILGLCLTKHQDKVVSALQKSSSSGNSKFIATDLLDLISSKCALENDELSSLKVTLAPFVSSVTLDNLMEEDLRNISKLEVDEVQSLRDRMKAWTLDRQYALDAHLEELTRDRLIGEIRKKRQQLKDREKMLYFFENLDSIELELKEAEDSIAESKKKTIVEEDYVPPTVARSISQKSEK